MGGFGDFITGIFDGGSSAASGGSSIWSNPTVLSSAILAGTQLVSGLFGSSSEEEAAQQQADEQKRQFDATLALKQADLAQALEIAKLQIAARGGGGDGGAGAARDAALRQARANAIGQAAQMKIAGMKLPLEAMQAQSEAAQQTGQSSGQFFNSLIPNLEAPALSRAR